MPTQILKSIKGKVVRLTRLDECGVPVIGSCSTLVSECFVSVTLSPEFEEGDEYLEKNAWGEACILDKNADFIKWINVSINFAEINPDALDIITAANPVTSAGSVIGASYGQSMNEAAFALEVWTKRTNATTCSTSAPEWGYFVVPFVRNGRLDGDVTIENAALTLSMVGQGWPAPTAWDETPYVDNPFVEPFPAGDFFGMVVTDIQPPTDTAGCVALA